MESRIKELISRPSPAIYTTNEMAEVVEYYINDKKNINVKININKNIPKDSIVAGMLLDRQLELLDTAFNVAQKELIKNYSH